MPGRLAAFVHVCDALGVAHVFGPDDDIPDWAAAKITNPKAWAEPPDVIVDASLAPQGAGATSAPSDGRPPKTGQGSSREVWAAYAAVRGVGFDENATKAEIIAAVEAAEQP